uniref:Uncharacterized protein n=1 Tax=Arundo donax TaxID=35708 RepID=A0A0A9AV29_ARUDO
MALYKTRQAVWINQARISNLPSIDLSPASDYCLSSVLTRSRAMPRNTPRLYLAI